MYNNLFTPEKLQEAWRILCAEAPLAIWETIYITFLATFFAIAIGLPLGVILVVGEKNGILPLPAWLMKIINAIVNLLRSIPFLLLIALATPLIYFLTHKTAGNFPFIIHLTIAAFPFVARLVESSLRELDPNVIEAAQSMGASPFQIIVKVMIPESIPSLISNFAIGVTTILGYTAMSGVIAGGGLGNMAWMHGYQRYRFWVALGAVVLIIIMVQILQSVGSFLAAKSDKRLKHK